MRPKHYKLYALRRLGREGVAAPRCDPDRVLSILRDRPNAALSWFDCAVAIVTTLFKRAGISGWSPTGCVALARGVAVRDAQHSTDGFWTIDVRLAELSIGDAAVPPDRYLRVEVEPGTAAHEVCARSKILEGTRLEVGGEIVIDNDPPPFAEIHPDARFELL